MKGNYKKLMPIVLIILMAFACYSVVNNAISIKSEYDGYMKAANEAMDKDIDIDVDEAFTKAADVKAVPEVYIKWANYYYNKEDYAKSVLICEDAQSAFGKEPVFFTLLMKDYLAQKDYKEFFNTYKKCKTIKRVNKEIQELYEKNQYVFTLDMDNYLEAFPFSNGIARVKRESYSDEKEYFGYVGNAGSIPAQYQDAGDFNSDEISVAPVVSSNGEPFYINTEGLKKYVIKPKKVSVKKLGFYSCGVLSVFDGKQYYLSDIKSNIIAGPFEYVSTINQNIGVIKEANKWKIINEKGEKLVDKTFSDIILDSKEIAFRGGMFVSEGNGYYLINEKGEKVGDQIFDDAKLFIDSFAAVKKNGKWGFIDQTGKLVIDYQFHDAISFSSGLAAVKLNGLWGYISYDNNNNVKVAIDYQFNDAIGFSKRIAMVKIDNDWKLLRLYN